MIYHSPNQDYLYVAEENCDACAELLAHLNEDLAGECQAVVMELQYAAVAKRRLYDDRLYRAIQSILAADQAHVQFLADKIAVLGGIPSVSYLPIPEAGDALSIVENLLEVKLRAIAAYTRRSEEAELQDEIGLMVELETQLVEEIRHKQQLERLLAISPSSIWERTELPKWRPSDFPYPWMILPFSEG